MRKRKRLLYLFYLPAVIILLVFVLRPFFETLYISLCDWNGYSSVKQFVGFENYLEIFSDERFRTALVNTLILHHELRKMKQEEEAASEEKTILTPEVKSHLEIVLGYPIVSENVRDLTDELWEKTAGRDMGIRTDEELIVRICRYVRQNYMADVSLDRLAENFNITPAYLSRFFREKTGEKYIDYVTEVRMEKARELLDTRQYTVKEVSRMVGYLSEKHFSRNFKKYFGENPSQI